MVIPQTGRYMQRPYSHHAMQLTPSHFAGRRLATATAGAALTPVTEISQKSKWPGLTHTNARRVGDSPLSMRHLPTALYSRSTPCYFFEKSLSIHQQMPLFYDALSDL